MNEGIERLPAVARFPTYGPQEITVSWCNCVTSRSLGPEIMGSSPIETAMKLELLRSQYISSIIDDEFTFRTEDKRRQLILQATCFDIRIWLDGYFNRINWYGCINRITKRTCERKLKEN